VNSAVTDADDFRAIDFKTFILDDWRSLGKHVYAYGRMEMEAED
jgi:hypothetical protein